MGWMDWRRAIRRVPARSSTPARPSEPMIPTDAIRDALVRRGVPEPLVEPLARRLTAYTDGRDPARLAGVLDGITIALDMQKSTHDQLSKSLRGLREVERMMGAFSGELSKLDEVLGVLAAYVRRMRTSGTGESDRTLH